MTALDAVPGLTLSPSGRAGLHGPALALSDAIDRSITDAAATFGAEPVYTAPFLDPADLRAIDYFTSFPHLVMLPAAVSVEGRDAFRAENAAGIGPRVAPVALGALAPVTAVLAPAACYGVYPLLRGASLVAPRCFTTLGSCFRNEDHEQPLRRQRCFRMREIVHVGTADSCRAFAASAEAAVEAIAKRWQLPVAFAVATDPFFDPARSPRYVHQRLFPSKREAVYTCTDDGAPLAIASVNVHRSFFGEAFAIDCQGAPASTACLAFGLERWLYAALERHGRDPGRWPVAADRSVNDG